MRINSKIQKKKEEKKSGILDSAFKLFLLKGINSTTVDDITKTAGLAKGTFYLYFKDKYAVKDELITRESKKLFDKALIKLEKKKIKGFTNQLIFVIDEVIKELEKNKILLKFISKNLSWGLYQDTVNNIVKNDTLDLKTLFYEGIKKEKLKIKNPEIKLFMIIELVSSTCFTVIMTGKPLNMSKFKPYLYEEIKKMIKE